MRSRSSLLKELNRLTDENATLESLSRMKSAFLANMSHEIKTPLTAINADVQLIERLLDESGFENERVARSLTRAQDEIMRLARLTESVLKMAAMQGSQDEMKPLDATSLFTINAEAYRGIIEKQNNILNISAQKDLPSILGNVDRLIQVLSNLLVNANKHTTNGEIAVIVELCGKCVSVTVKDNGTGVSPELLPYTFDWGVSGSGSTGFGLAICRSIIDSHNGTITLESEQNKGTAVTFTIPAHEDPPSTNSPPP